MQSKQTGLEIAIIGISGRFPRSEDIDSFWKNLIKGVELTSVLPDSESKDTDIESKESDQRNQTIKAGAILDDVEFFDASFFGFNPREAETMDPQHRLFLECAWEALENAGYNSEIEERPIGVYAGVGMGTYLLYNLSPNRDLMESRGFLPILVGVDKDYLPTRVSYKLNLKGPSLSVGTACSSSLVAVHLACQSLLSGECDMALAAGVAVKVPQNEVTLSPGEIISPDGHCRAFDAKANGTIGGNGIGVVVLKRLEDAIADRDHIYAVIKGSAINNDGALKVGYTAPSEEGQTRVIRTAQIMAEVEPETITYMETHGTGTPLGDPIEIAAMTQAFRASTEKKGYCAIGSVKTNVGHLDAAAGIAGLIKTVLALESKLLPPTLNFETPNPQIDFENSPFYVNTELSEWKASGTPRRAGVSSFGFGGTNAHVILEEAPVVEASSPSRSRQLLLLSAKTSSALETATTNLANRLKQHPELNLADVAYTLQVGRRALNHRRMVLAEDIEDVLKALESDPQRVFTSFTESSDRSVVFMFTGQGAQYVNMAREIYQSEAIFRQECDRCCELLKPQLGLDLRQLLYPTEEEAQKAAQQLQQTAITQPALFVIEYALARLWMSWGVHPVAMIGHSIGEYVAACLAGVFSLEDALALVTARGQLMQQLPSGSMLAVPLPEKEVQPILGEPLSLAAINGSSSCVVSGATEAVEALQNKLASSGVDCRRLHTSHAFHSQMMEPILEPFQERVKQVTLKSPQIPYISNVTGTWIAAQEAMSPQYWTSHLRQTVRFAEGLQELLKKPDRVLLEVGPGRTLSKLAKQLPEKKPEQVVLTSIRHPQEKQSDVTFLLNTLGQLWLAGVQVDWSGFYAHEQRDRLPLPTYPFERQRYWIEPPKQATEEYQPLLTPAKLWKSLVEAGQLQANTTISESDQHTYRENQQGLDRLCIAYMNLALRNLGAFSNFDKKYSLEELYEQCQVILRYRQLLSRWLQVLTEQGHLQQDKGLFTNLVPCSTEAVNALLEEVRVRWADSPKVVDLVERCGNNLAAILIGKKEALEFFKGFLYDFNAAENINLKSPWHTHYSAIIRAILGQAVSSLSPLANLRILEIGSGVAYATEELLPVLPLQQTNYTFVDVSDSFLNEAKKKFSKYPFIECRSLDINRLPTEQGYSKGSFDVVVAVKSLHIAKNIDAILQNVRSLLAPGGLLLIWEKTQQTLDLDITWALLMNPLKEEERSLDHLYLSKEQWQEALRANGFVEVAAFPETEALRQHVLVAQASPSAALSVPSAFTKTLEQNDARQTPQGSSGKKPDIADWFYIPSWKRCLPPQLQSGVQAIQSGCWLVFVDECSLAASILKRLELENQDVVIVRVGEQFSRNSQSAKSQNAYTINPRQPGDYDALLKELTALKLTPKTIVHLWSLTPQGHTVSGLENVDQAQEKGFYSLLFLAQALGKQNVTSKLQITVISNNLQSVSGQEVLSPEKATLLGSVKVIPQEYPNIHCRSIDIILPEAGSLQEEKLVDCLLAEFNANDSEKVIAYRGIHRWMPAFEQVRLDEASDGTSRLRQGGVYLITGGLGAIGLDFASHLAKTVQAKLILIGRSTFPAKDEWDEWLINHDQGDDVSRKICKLKELEELGAEIFVARADVADFDAMQQAIAQAQEQFGQINGVFHAAGVLGDGAIGLKTREDVESVLAPKVRGTLVLDAILKDVELDFIVLCSSRASIAPVFGQISYCSANNFLDAFAHYKTAKDGTFTVSVNLVNAWLGGGIAVEAAKKLARTRTISQPQSKAVTNPLFDQCLVEGSNEIYISTLSVSKHWFLDEHRVNGKATLPGTAYLEIVLAACENQARTGLPEIQDVTFLAPLVVEDGKEKQVRTLLRKQGDGFEFLFISQSNPESEQWIEHVTGKIAFTEAKLPQKQVLQEIEISFEPEEAIAPEQRHKLQTEFFEFGERWNNLKQVKLGKNKGLAVLELPEVFIDDLNTYKLHPALLDRAVGFPILKFKDEGLYLPFSYKRLQLKGPLTSKLYSYITAIENHQSQAETLKFNITIMDDRGNELVEIEDYTMRKVSSGKTDTITAKPSGTQREKISPVSESDNFYLTISSPGVLSTLTFRPETRQKPGPGEVEIEVSTTGLNFKEVLFALGLIPVSPDFGLKFGLECAGKIVARGEDVEDFKIGDEAIAFGSSCFSRFITIPAKLVALKPKHLSLQEAATIPTAFTTAYYALIEMGRLCQGEKVLIHAAAGGVGMAAIQIAKWVGAQIFATAGSPEKRQFLRSLGIEHVMDSRSVAFADEVMKRTNDKGVDVVLNSLGGEFIPKSLSVLARYGRFLELGQRDILNNSQLELKVFEKCLSFFAIQVNPELPNFSSLWREVVRHFQAGNFSPLAHRVFPITEVAEAFKYMAGAKHIGKIVVSIEDNEAIKTQVIAENIASQEATEFVTSPAVLPHRSSVNSSVGSGWLKQATTPISEFQVDLLKDGYDPSEGIEVFRRILRGTLPQVLVSTTDFMAVVSQNTVEEPSNKVNLRPATQPTHPRPELNNVYVAPRNEAEQKLASIWQELLGLKQVGIHDNFFELGGDSLLATQVISQMRLAVKMDLPLNILFDEPTVADIAKYVEKIRCTTQTLQAPISTALDDRMEIEI